MHELNTNVVSGEWRFHADFSTQIEAACSARELYDGGLTAKVDYEPYEPRNPYSVHVLVYPELEVYSNVG